VMHLGGSNSTDEVRIVIRPGVQPFFLLMLHEHPASTSVKRIALPDKDAISDENVSLGFIDGPVRLDRLDDTVEITAFFKSLESHGNQGAYGTGMLPLRYLPTTLVCTRALPELMKQFFSALVDTKGDFVDDEDHMLYEGKLVKHLYYQRDPAVETEQTVQDQIEGKTKWVGTMLRYISEQQKQDEDEGNSGGDVIMKEGTSSSTGGIKFIGNRK